jgi:hypothetical protein
MCYSPERCNGFNGVPFFNIYDISMSENSSCKLNLCFRNVSEALNNSNLTFFLSEKVICDTTVHTARTYIRSFEIRGELFICAYVLYVIRFLSHSDSKFCFCTSCSCSSYIRHLCKLMPHPEKSASVQQKTATLLILLSTMSP